MGKVILGIALMAFLLGAAGCTRGGDLPGAQVNKAAQKARQFKENAEIDQVMRGTAGGGAD